MALRRPRPRKSDDDRILPLVNIVFLLLIFFMIAGQLTRQDLFEISPPETVASSPDDSDEETVLFAADGRIAYRGEAADEAGLLAALRARAAGGQTAIRLKADARAEAAAVARLLQRMREAGMRDIRLISAAGR